MKRPKSMPVLLDLAALTVVVVNLPFALYGYLLFGSSTQGEWLKSLSASTPAHPFGLYVRLHIRELAWRNI